MFKVQSKHSYVDLFEGIIIGASLAAAATFIFGTKKGKELQKELVHQYQTLGYTTAKMRKKIEKLIKSKSENKIKRAAKSKGKKVNAKTKHIKKQTHRKAAA